MASTYQMHAQYFRQNPLTVDTLNAQNFFDEDDSGILDDGILDHSTLESSLELSPPMTGSRRDSFAVSASLFSPKTEDWQSVDMQSLPSNNPFLEPQHSNNPFIRGDQTPATYGPQSQAWSIGQGSGTCTPFQYDGLDTGYDNSAALFQQRAMPTQTPFGNPGAQVAALFSNAGNHTIPSSPQKDWMGQDVRGQSMKRARSPSGIRSHNDLRRGDGIRKKNARFDIPAERNLLNIDNLIAQSTDDSEVKELKQQKRLLRNRQAALDSRQRKKMHTERLEDEKKQFTNLVNGMEEEIAELNMKLDALLRENHQLKNHIEVVVIEKEEMVQAHTMETGDLRKKVSVLTDHVQRLESSSINSNNGFDSGFGEMESMAMDAPWDSMNFIGDFPTAEESKPQMQMMPVKKAEVSLPAESDKPSNQGGLLFMLFLVGAFVLSSRSTPQIPKVSEDVRAASESLLNDVLKDAALAHGPDSVLAMAPQPSGASWAAPSSMPTATGMMGSVAPSMLGAMADSLTQPSEQQTNEQLFGLTPAQFNAVQEQTFIRPAPPRSTSEGRKNLADTLAAMRNNDKQNAAEVYTRSLLWDQIPRDVVRNFAKMMAESNNANSN
ncbi:transcriptional activator HAC1 [Microdochium nivale]|nr:transcriptional activator HAC1 [Microdochium nivale]